MKNGQNYNSALCLVSITDSVPAYEAVEIWVQIPSGAPLIWDSSPTGRGVGFKFRMFWVRIPGVLPLIWL